MTTTPNNAKPTAFIAAAALTFAARHEARRQAAEKKGVIGRAYAKALSTI